MVRERYFELVGGGIRKFWKVSRDADLVTVHFGRIGTDGQTKTKRHPDNDVATAEMANLIKEKLAKGYLEKGQAKNKAGETDSETGGKTGYQRALECKRGSHAWRAVLKHAEEPFSAALTRNVFHRFALKGKGKGKDKGRATSGGCPILAEGQAWPVCAGCNQPQSLLLQFDIDEAFGLCFEPGSHFLFFSCAACQDNPSIAKKALTKEFLDPKSPRSYRVILNRPGVSEVVQQADPSMLLQSPLTFSASPEELKNGLDCPIGADGIKIGGAPYWTQPPNYKRCYCGAPLGFILQIPEGMSPGWRQKNRQDISPFLGNPFFVFACSRQCNPYAAVVLVE